jgi:hypothetical protein
MRKVLELPSSEQQTFGSAYLGSPRPLLRPTRANSTSPDLHSLHHEDSVTLPVIQNGDKLAKLNEIR